jgi:hypothetical protein
MGKAVTKETKVAEAPLDPRDAVLRVRDAARAVEIAFGKDEGYAGLPANLLTPLGVAAGMAPYRSPEVRNGGAQNEAATVYSLGSILYALIVGSEPDPHSPQPPFQCDSRVPDDLEQLIRAAMHVDPIRRMSATALAVALSDWLDSQRAPELLPAPDPPAWKDALVITGLLALLIAGLAWPVPRGHDVVSEPVSRSVPLLATAAKKASPPSGVMATPLRLPDAPMSSARGRPKAASLAAATPADAVTSTLQPPARVGTVRCVDRRYGVFVALEAPATLGVGDTLEAVRDGSVVAILTVRILSPPDPTYPHGVAVCDTSNPWVGQGQVQEGLVHTGSEVRRPKP